MVCNKNKPVFPIGGRVKQVYKSYVPKLYEGVISKEVNKSVLIILKDSKNKQELILGFDEAGKGAVLGPLVLATVGIQENKLRDLRRLKVRDSKKLSRKQLLEKAEKIMEVADYVAVYVIPPKIIDKFVEGENKSLNFLMLLKYRELLDSAPAVKRVEIDSFYHDKHKLEEALVKYYDKPVKVIAEHHAEEAYLTVASASIIAKVVREVLIDQLKEKYGDFGSGYPGDSKTIEWLKQSMENYGRLPAIVRKSWSTIKKIIQEIPSKEKLKDELKENKKDNNVLYEAVISKEDLEENTEVHKVPPEEVIASLRTILKRYYHAPNNDFEIYHELRFAIEANLLHMAKYSVSEVLYIMNNLTIVDVTYERLKQEISYIAEHGYVYPTFTSFQNKAKNQLTFVSKDQEKEYAKVLKRLWDLFIRLEEANKEVSKTHLLFKVAVKALSEGLDYEKVFKRILYTAKDVTFFGHAFKNKKGKEGIITYTSIVDLANAYLKKRGKDKITKDDLEDFKNFIKEEVTEVAVFHDYMIKIDFDSKDLEVNLKASKKVFERLKKAGLGELIYYTTGGKGSHINVVFPVILDKEKVEVLKQILFKRIRSIIEEAVNDERAKIEVLDGSNKALTLWAGKHRKTGKQREILGYEPFNIKAIIDIVKEELLNKITEIKELPLNFKGWTLDMLLLLYMQLERATIEDKKTIINKLRSFMEDLEDEDYKIPHETLLHLVNWTKEGAFIPVKEYNLEDFEEHYGFKIEEDKLNKMIEAYTEKLEGLPVRVDGCVFDFETRNSRVFAFEPVMATFYFPKIERLTVWIKDNEDVVEDYRGRYITVRVVKTEDPEVFLGAVFPEWLILGVMKKYLKFGSYLYELDLKKFKIYRPNLLYLERYIENPKKLYLIGFNVGFDFPLLMDLIAGKKGGSVIQEELTDGDLITINLYDGVISVSGRIRVTRATSTMYTKVYMKIGDQYIKGFDVADLGRFWQTKTEGTGSRSLKSLSNDFNQYFTKIGDFDVRKYEKWEELKESKEFSLALKYNVYDVLATYELLFSLIPIEIKQEFKEFAYVLNGKKILKVSNFIEIEDFLKIVSGATIPKTIYGKLIEELGSENYRNNSIILNNIFDRFYYGGRVFFKPGRTKDVEYVDFASEYPHIMNYLFIENIMANLALCDLNELFRPLEDSKVKAMFIQDFEYAIDHFIKNMDKPGAYEYIANLARKYPQGIFYITPFRAKVIDSKIHFHKKGNYFYNGYWFKLANGGNAPRMDLKASGQFTVDLPTLIYHAVEWRVKNKNAKWKQFWKKEERIDWNNSAVFMTKSILKPFKEYEAYGVRSYSIPHYALHIRQRYRKLKKEAKAKGNKELEKLYEKKQLAFKILANASYGATAEENWKYLNKMISSAITGFGRLQQRLVQLLGEIQGIEMVYGDTDSAMFRVPEGKKEVFERIRSIFNNVDELKIEAEIEELEIFASKNYRYREKGSNKWKTKIHGKGSYNAKWFNKWVFEEEFFNKLYEYLEGNEQAKGYSEPAVASISIRAKNGQPGIIGKLVKYSKHKEKMIQELGYYIDGKYLTTHILPPGHSPFGKFFKMIKVNGVVPVKTRVYDEISDSYDEVYVNQKVEYVVTAFYSDEEVAEFLKSLNLKIYRRSVYEIVKSRLANIRERLFKTANELGLQEFRNAFKEYRMINGNVPEITLKRRPVGIRNYIKDMVKRHSTEWIYISSIEKPTSYYFDVRHYSKAWANLYNMEKRLVGLGWIDKSVDEVIFRYKIDEKGNLIKASKDDDAHVIIRVPLRAYDVRRNPASVKVNQDYLTKIQYKIFLTINLPEPKPLGIHKSMKYKVMNQWLQDIKPYLEYYVVDFSPKSVSVDVFQRLYDSIAIKKVLDEVLRDIQENLKEMLLLKEHFTEDFEVDRKLAENVEFVLGKYSRILKDSVFEQLYKQPASVKRVFALSKVIDSSGLHLQAKGIRLSLYNHTYSKLGRLQSRFRKEKTVRALKNFDSEVKRLTKVNSVIFRIELEADRKLIENGIEVDDNKLDIIDLFEGVKAFFRKVLKIAEIINELKFKVVHEYILKAFEAVVKKVLNFMKMLRSKGRALVTRLRRYTTVLISLLATDHSGEDMDLWGLAKKLMNKVEHSFTETIHSIEEYVYHERNKEAWNLYMEYKKGDDLDTMELDNSLRPKEHLSELRNKFSLKYRPDLIG